jgi:hypothetical protein
VTKDGQLAALRTQLVARAGGYFRNLVTEGTCSRCYTPIHGVALCSRCRQDDATAGLPDARGFMIYASGNEPIQQSGRVMHDYKSPIFRSDDAVRTVTLLAALALQGHRACPGRLVGAQLTAWAVVPSLPPKVPDTHQLARILRSLARPKSIEIVLRGIDQPADPRSLSATHFLVQTPVPDGAHVLLIDDTWTSGGHVQSAALALRAAGAAHVSVLVLARWLSEGWGATSAAWMKANLSGPDYNPDICPWTQGPCPS